MPTDLLLLFFFFALQRLDRSRKWVGHRTGGSWGEGVLDKRQNNNMPMQYCHLTESYLPIRTGVNANH